MNARNALVLTVAISSWGALSGLVPPQLALSPSDESRLLYPPAGAVVTANPVLIMILARKGDFTFELDGDPLTLEKMTFAEAWSNVPEKILLDIGSDDLPLRSPLLAEKDDMVLWVTAQELAAGEHTLSRDGVALGTFFLRNGEEREGDDGGAPILRVHASPSSKAEALDCTQCHEATGPSETLTLGVARAPESCHDCHDDANLSLSHEHVMEHLAKCQLCHDPHAATRESLLIDSRDQVCGMCHDSGYSR